MEYYQAWRHCCRRRGAQMMYRIRNKLDPEVPIEDQCPEWLSTEEWKIMCGKWKDKDGKFQKYSKAAKENIKKKNVFHTTGNIKFDRLVTRMVSNFILL